MATPISDSFAEAMDLNDLVSTALRQDRREGLSEMLSVIARSVNAQACILWHEAPFAHSGEDPESKELFVLADWVEGDERSSFYNLSLKSSATGEAIRTKAVVKIIDAMADRRVDQTDPFLRDFGTRSFCSLPVRFLEGDWGALNAYRKTVNPFTPAEIENLVQMVELLPQLYQTISDKVSYKLVSRINSLLQKEESGDAQALARKVCRTVANTFQTVEVSLFLNSLKSPHKFQMRGSTWTSKEDLPKTFYKPFKEEGLTGWVLEKRKPVRIFDLRKFEQDREQIRKQYSDIIWGDSLRIESNLQYQLTVQQGLRTQLEASKKQRDQPLSFMAAPVMAEGKLLGALRCCTVKEGPFYFSQREMTLLALVADQIGQAWSSSLRREALEEEITSWQTFTEEIAQLNHSVQNQVKSETPDEANIFQRSLEIAHDVIPNAEILDIRLVDAETQELYFAHTHGLAWGHGSQEEKARRLATRHPTEETSPTTTGSFVVRTKKVFILCDTSNPKGPYKPMFTEVRRMLTAPIPVADQVFGVLGISDTSDRAFPEYAVAIIKLLGQQLGLYHYLFQTVSELRRLPRLQTQIFEDFTHQLRSPINQVRQRTQICIRLAEGRLEKHLLALRGLASKAKRATGNLSFFSRLAEEKKLKPARSRLRDGDVIRMLIEAKLDLLSTLNPARKIEVTVEEDGFKALRRQRVEIDRDMLWHAVNIVIDNAAKYSFKDSNIRIYGGFTGTRRFHITILNTGISFTKDDIHRCTDRGWRGEKASRVVGEGSGIGLWIVHHIMKAHGGQLMIIPTDANSRTEIKLIFPG